MKNSIQEFSEHLHNTRKADNTILSYERDLRKLQQFLEQQGVTDAVRVTETNLNSYMLDLERRGFAPATVSRNVAVIKRFFGYLTKRHRIPEDPAEELKPPRIERRTPETLSEQQVQSLLEQPDQNTAKGIRDWAMIALLYASGIHISEMLKLQLSDLNLVMGYLVCREQEKERILLLNEQAAYALKRYLKEGRSRIAGAADDGFLFLNCSGTPMSRQGVWKLLKSYGRSAGIAVEITPDILRHSHRN